MSNAKAAGSQPVKRSAAQVRDDISAVRRELAETLDALEYKFDVPARLTEWVQARQEQVQRLWKNNPALVVGVLAGTVAVIGGIVTGALTLPRRGR